VAYYRTSLVVVWRYEVQAYGAVAVEVFTVVECACVPYVRGVESQLDQRAFQELSEFDGVLPAVHVL